MFQKISAFFLAIFSIFLVGCGESFDASELKIEIPAGQAAAEFQSPKISEDEEFTGWFAKFRVDGDAQPRLIVRFDGGEWIEPELDGKDGDGRWATAAVVVPATSWEFEFTLAGEAGATATSFEFETVNLDSAKIHEFFPVAEAAVTDLDYVSREDWKADEGLRLVKNHPNPDDGVPSAKSKKMIACEELQSRQPNEFRQTDEEVDTLDGEELWWPQTYSDDVAKIVVHATISDVPRDINGDGVFDEADADAIVRAIYFYHAKWKNWGDIGYNFLIDPFGRVFEGRAGGHAVVAGHAFCANTNTIGVAFIGDFREQPPTEAALAAGVELLGELANEYKIDLAARSTWHEKDTLNLVGHREYGATNCPGDALMAELPDLATAAMEYARKNKLSEEAYDFRVVSSDSPAVIAPFASENLEVSLKNIGTEVWPAGGEFRVDSNDLAAAVGGVSLDSDSEVVGKLNRDVGRGQNYTLRIPVRGDLKTGRYRLGISPSWQPNARKYFVVVTVGDPQLDYEVVSAKHPPQPFNPGSEGVAWVELKNKSNFTWKHAGKNRVYLATTQPDGHVSPFTRSDELASLDVDVAPGETGRFVMNLTAPTSPGRYWITFAPAIKNIGYFPDYGMKFHPTVREPRLTALVTEKSRAPDLKFGPAEEREIEIEFRNTGEIAWEPEKFHVELAGSNELDYPPALQISQAVEPQQTIKFYVPVVAPKKAGRYPLALNLIWDKKRFSQNDFAIEVEPPRLTGEWIDGDKFLQLEKGESAEISFALENTGNVVWRQADVVLQRLPAAVSSFAGDDWQSPVIPTTLAETEVGPGEVGHFSFTVHKNSAAKNQTESFTPIVRGIGRIRGPAAKIEVASENSSRQRTQISTPKTSEPEVATPTETPKIETPTVEISESEIPDIRIRLSFDSPTVGIGGGDLILRNSAGAEIFRGSFVDFDAGKMADGEFFRVEPAGDTILEVANWDHSPAWTDKINDNKFRGILEVRKIGDNLTVINELPLEDYIRGIAEPLPTDPEEKAKLLAVLARSYALFYTDPAHRKYPGQPYDGSDNPAEFQRYLGYSYELRGNMPEAAEATEGLVATVDGEVVKTPYFTRSSGRTKTAAEAKWDAHDFRFTKSVEDPWSCGLNSNAIGTNYSCPELAAGHGVGVSGAGAAGLAAEGKTFREIIDYFFDGVEVEKVW